MAHVERGHGEQRHYAVAARADDGDTRRRSGVARYERADGKQRHHAVASGAEVGDARCGRDVAWVCEAATRGAENTNIVAPCERSADALCDPKTHAVGAVLRRVRGFGGTSSRFVAAGQWWCDIIANHAD
jgi:hypothetical protein